MTFILFTVTNFTEHVLLIYVSTWYRVRIPPFPAAVSSDQKNQFNSKPNFKPCNSTEYVRDDKKKAPK